jgi:predicted dehydrogenase/threonine dehydrogenase-like Zn-dependent dehydrogenase
MRQIVQSVRDGQLRLAEVPQPELRPTEVLVHTVTSIISTGTEKAVRALAGASLLTKARQRPDLVRQVLKRVQSDGPSATFRSVNSRLNGEMPLGYSACGVVLEVGELVSGLLPGDLVATAGAGHAEIQVVSGLLCAKVPEGVSASDAAFSTIGSIGFHGLRLAALDPGSVVVIVGLGLLGQVTARLAKASGFRVIGIDITKANASRMETIGLRGLVESGDVTTEEVLHFSRGRGADAVVVTAASKSSDLMKRVPVLCRDGATISVIGDVGLELDRTPLYEKELKIVVARSYGPGRYERGYEDWGVDLPPHHVRWTAGRNMEAVLDLLAAGNMSFADLVTNRFKFDDALQAYSALEEKGTLAVALDYGIELEEQNRSNVSERLRPESVKPPLSGQPQVGVLGAGLYARATLLPIIESSDADIVAIGSASGRSAEELSTQFAIPQVQSPSQVIARIDLDAIFLLTPHSTHDELIVRCLEGKKHVFCEKPIAITEEGLERVEECWTGSGLVLFGGFNRRYSGAIREVQQELSGDGPLQIIYRVNAGRLPSKHWYHDRNEGGRLIGEVCHFIDTCNALTAAPPKVLFAVGRAPNELVLAENMVITISYSDGSQAVIIYGTEGHASVGKEYIEIIGQGKQIVVDDFTSFFVNGKSRKLNHRGKGHTEEVQAFLAQCKYGATPTDIRRTGETFRTMRATFAAVESLALGRPVKMNSQGRSTGSRDADGIAF